VDGFCLLRLFLGLGFASPQGYKYLTPESLPGVNATRLYQAALFSQQEYICVNLQLARHSLARRLVYLRFVLTFAPLRPWPT